ncbi:MAG TPA: AMP-binding protein, partial [Blastocatellia bacterium]|nr:AMP-binding protein [Blastocatellia bacterium]
MNLASQTTVAPVMEMPRPVPLPTDEPKTLVGLFERVARLHQKPDTLNYKKDGRWLSLSADEMLARARSIAAGLYSLGVRHGDRVAILSESRCEWTLSDAGCQFAGAIDVPIYPTLTPPQAAYILKDSGSRVLILANHQKYVQLREVLKECTAVEHVVIFDNEGVEPGEAMTLAALEEIGRALEAKQPRLIDEIAHQTRADDLATIIYTSGTTGEPKGVMLTHANLVSNVVDSAGRFAFGSRDSALSVLPLSHVFERSAMYMYLYHGMAVYFGESLDRIGQNLREVRPTIFVGVPRIFEKIYARVKEKAAGKGKLNLALLNWSVAVGTEVAKLTVNHRRVPFLLSLEHKLANLFVFAKWRQALGGRIRLLISGGAALPEDLGYIYIGAGLPIVQGYG